MSKKVSYVIVTSKYGNLIAYAKKWQKISKIQTVSLPHSNFQVSIMGFEWKVKY